VVSATTIVFTEKQRVARVWWITAVVAAGAVVAWVLFVRQVLMHHPMGQHPPSNFTMVALWLLLGVIAPQVLLICGLTTVVRAGEILVSYPPLANRSIQLSEVTEVRAVTYRPFGDYWGWGVRGRRRNICYTVRGNRGVRLELTEGRRVLLGSQRAEELAAVLAQRLPPR
jgi:hypothetical protein